MRHPMSLRNPVSKSPVSRYPVIEPYTSAKQTHILKKALNIRSVASLNKRVVLPPLSLNQYNTVTSCPPLADTSSSAFKVTFLYYSFLHLLRR